MGLTYPTSSYMASDNCLGFIFSAAALLRATDCFTIEEICCRSSSCHKLFDSVLLTHTTTLYCWSLQEFKVINQMDH